MLASIIFISISCIIIWRSSNGFEIASDFLGRKMPLGIKGATLNAVASSMPEFLTTLFFLFYLRDSDGFSGDVAALVVDLSGADVEGDFRGDCVCQVLAEACA